MHTDRSLWQPSSSHHALRERAALNRQIRAFFEQHGVLEVETPLLMQASAAEPHLVNFQCGQKALQTSPESAMKRLLCAGFGPIYQLCKAFRAGESGARHNSEFTMLEWYQPQYTMAQLQQQTLALITALIGSRPLQHYRYGDIFKHVTQLDPSTCDDAALQAYARTHIDGVFEQMSRSDWLDLIMSCCVEPRFDTKAFTVVTEFPACQAALAKISANAEGHWVAQRFEIYSGGLELANGYDEECDPTQLHTRLDGKDPAMLAAFKQSDLRQCSGVAVGVDRLLMLKLNATRISEVLSFDDSRA